MRDHERIPGRLGQIGEQLRHLGSTLEPVLGRQPAALLLADLSAIGDAQQDVVRLVVGGVDEVHVVGRDQRQTALEGEVDQGRLDLLLGREPVAHQLDVKPAREQRREPGQQRLAETAVAVQQCPAERPLGATGERDQPVRGARQVIEPDLRRAAITAEIGATQQLQQVLVAALALDQDRQPGGRRGPAVGARGVVDGQRQQTADQRLHARLGGLLADRERVEQIGPIGDPDRGHGVRPATLHQLLQPHRALEQRVAGADAEMDEGGVTQAMAPVRGGHRNLGQPARGLNRFACRR